MARERSRARGALSGQARKLLLALIAALEERGFPPTVRELGALTGLKSTSTVHAYLQKLEQAGYIRRDAAQPRALVVLRDADGAPYAYHQGEEASAAPQEPVAELAVMGRMGAEGALFGEDVARERLPYPARFLDREGAYMLRNGGEAMEGVGILDGDYLVVEPDQAAENGDIVVVLVGDEVLCRSFYREKQQVRLQPENAALPPIYVENPMVIGKVVGVLRDLHGFRGSR